jgi:hypothetical protein
VAAQGRPTPGAKAPFPLAGQRAKPEGLAYLEALSEVAYLEALSELAYLEALSELAYLEPLSELAYLEALSELFAGNRRCRW